MSPGGGVVDHLLADKRKKYHIRAVSRNTSSAKAEALADQGVEVVQGDLGDKDSLMKVQLVVILLKLVVFMEGGRMSIRSPLYAIAQP